MSAPQTAAAVVKKLFPLLDRVLVRKIEGPTRTPGGLMIPERALNRIPQGEVIAVGPGSRSSRGELVPVMLKVGDKVILPEHGGIKVNLESEEREYQLFREADILARVELETTAESTVEAPTPTAC